MNYHDCSIASRVRPFVSGTRNQTNKHPRSDMPQKTQKVAAGPAFSSRTGNVCVTRYTAAQRANVATDMATPRILIGKISAISTQVTGPYEAAKAAI